jgi:AraC-like DNA-binding protein
MEQREARILIERASGVQRIRARLPRFVDVVYIHRGKLELWSAGRFIELPARRFALFYAGLPHVVQDPSPATAVFVRLSVPVGVLLRWSLGPGFLRRLLSGEVIIDRESLPWDADLTFRWLEDFRREHKPEGHAVALEIEARLRRLVLRQLGTMERSVPDEHRCGQVESIAHYLEERFRDDVSLEAVAGALQMREDYMKSLFRRECGLPIAAYLTRLRLAQAQLDLLDCEKSVVDVALESGFQSLARFYAAFRRDCGLSPLEYRRRRGRL